MYLKASPQKSASILSADQLFHFDNWIEFKDSILFGKNTPSGNRICGGGHSGNLSSLGLSFLRLLAVLYMDGNYMEVPATANFIEGHFPKVDSITVKQVLSNKDLTFNNDGFRYAEAAEGQSRPVWNLMLGKPILQNSNIINPLFSGRN